MGNEAWFFVGLFLLIFIVWIAIGGPTRPISFKGPILTSSSTASVAEGASFWLPQAPFPIGTTSADLSESSD